MALTVSGHVGTSAIYGNVVARSQFTPQQQAIMDAGGNYGGYAVVDGHFTYVGAGRTGEDARAAVYGTTTATAPATSSQPEKGGWMQGPSGYVGGVSTPTAPSPAEEVKPPVDDGTLAKRGDAFAQIAALLADYGLESLAPTVRDWVQQDLSVAEITLKLRDTPEFKAEFPEIDMRKKAGLTAISAGDIVSYRKQAAQLFQAAGLPQGFHDDKSDYTKFIAGDVSLAELSDRINLATQAAYKAPQEVRDALAEWGMGPGDLTAFWLNPDTAQPLLERKLAAAQLAGVSKRTGFGSLSEQQATDLALQGVTQDQAQSGFTQLQRSQELFAPLDAGENAITREEQIGGVLGGNAMAQQRIAARAARRKATFDAGGGFAAGQRGLVGLGRADR